jgi:hypothetical protein
VEFFSYLYLTLLADPYGLLTLRLLGKLGGKNRRFLREPLPLPPSIGGGTDTFDFPFAWTSVLNAAPTSRAGETRQFFVHIPIIRCTELLGNIATVATPKFVKCDNIGDPSSRRDAILWKDFVSLWDCRLESVDYDAYATNVMDETKANQALACVRIIAAGVSTLDLKCPESMALTDPIHQTRLIDLNRSELETKLRAALHGLLYGTMIRSSAVVAWDVLGEVLREVSPSWVASALCTFVSSSHTSVTEAGLEIVRRIVDDKEFVKEAKRDEFLLSLISSLSDSASVGAWKERIGPQKVLLFLVGTLGKDFTKGSEFRLISSALLSVKTIPRELSLACIENVRFFFSLCSLIYKVPRFLDSSHDFSIDPLLQYPIDRGSGEPSDAASQDEAPPSDVVVKLVLQELASPHHASRYGCIVLTRPHSALTNHSCHRFVARVFLSNIVSAYPTISWEEKFGSTLRKLVFSRSLRILPLPQQVGAIEALAVILNEFPGFLSITDQHFLSFLSELLKMCSVADGEVSFFMLCSPFVSFLLCSHAVCGCRRRVLLW